MAKKRTLSEYSMAALLCRLESLRAEHAVLNETVDALSRRQAMGNNQNYLAMKRRRVCQKTLIAELEAEIKSRDPKTQVGDSVLPEPQQTFEEA